ncbi:uncharacterized protein LOC128273605 [Anopheles cruzii]|uniref:uncharacterized protein LOC128273605 n=1 Tax=Anopheles cruzii TaxID=68878 RepID=UPI0022EC7F3F|nr:uncharacterized protein LOC128273605 [Anopheles cruzii]
MAVKGKAPSSKVLAKPGQQAIKKAVPTKEELSSDDDHIDEDMDSEDIESEEFDDNLDDDDTDDDEESAEDDGESAEDDGESAEDDEVMPAMGTAKKSPTDKALAARKTPASVGKSAPGKAETPKTPAKFVALGERDKRSVFLKHVRHQTTEAQIATFFESVGKVIKSRIVRSKGFAIVLFDKPEAVEKALTLSQECLNGDEVVIERCQSNVEKRKLKNRKQKLRQKQKGKTSAETSSTPTQKTKPASGGKQQPKGQQKKKAASVKQQGAPSVKTPLKKETKLVKKGNAAQATKGQPQNKKSPNAKKGKKQPNTK